MYYSSGNYEAFARPERPEGVDSKSAYLVGSGLGALAAACFLVRDGQMDGEKVHILEKDPIPGGACDGYHYDNLGYVMRGGRENHGESGRRCRNRWQIRAFRQRRPGDHEAFLYAGGRFV